MNGMRHDEWRRANAERPYRKYPVTALNYFHDSVAGCANADATGVEVDSVVYRNAPKRRVVDDSSVLSIDPLLHCSMQYVTLETPTQTISATATGERASRGLGIIVYKRASAAR